MKLSVDLYDFTALLHCVISDNKNSNSVFSISIGTVFNQYKIHNNITNQHYFHNF